MYERSFINPAVPAILFLITSVLIVVAWVWLGAVIAMPPSAFSAGEKLQCVSYAPFRGEQNPLNANTRIEAWQIDDDLARLKPLTDCVRTYSVEHGLDQIPALARKHGMSVIQGLWLSSNAQKNQLEIENVVKLVKEFPDVVRSIVVGNEVLLRGELSATDLGNIIRGVKSRVAVPVTYADVWEFWLRNRDLYAAVDFVTIHILPYWEDDPISAQNAVSHIDQIRRRMVAAFPDKEILIGETGWPSAGRMREGAYPSLANQALVVQGVLALARRDKFRMNIIEAFDQPWKRRLEGTVGGYWGLLDDHNRDLKFALGAPVSNHPYWRWQAAGGVAFCALVFAVGALVRRNAFPAAPPVVLWAGLALMAGAGGIFLGAAIEKVPIESLGAGGWLRSVVLAVLAGLMPLLGGMALMRDAPLPAFANILTRRQNGPPDALSLLLGMTLIVLVVVTIQVAAGLVFDPRYKDFPYAPLTAAIVPILVLSARQVRGASQRGTAEMVAAGALAVAAVYIAFNETVANWQSVWLCMLLVLFALSLLRSRERAAQS